jgi:hypothetical protein
LFLLAIAAKLRATLSLDSPTALPILRNDRLPNSAMLANTCLSRLRIAVLIFFSAPCYVFGSSRLSPPVAFINYVLLLNCLGLRG